MSCDTNWLKLQEVIKTSTKKNTLPPKSSEHVGTHAPKSRKRKKLDEETKRKDETQEKRAKKSSVLFKVSKTRTAPIHITWKIILAGSSFYGICCAC